MKIFAILYCQDAAYTHEKYLQILGGAGFGKKKKKKVLGVIIDKNLKFE